MPAQRLIDRVETLEAATDPTPRRGGVIQVDWQPWASADAYEASVAEAIAAAEREGRFGGCLVVVGPPPSEEAWERQAIATQQRLRREEEEQRRLRRERDGNA